MSIYKDVALDDLSFHSKTQAFCIVCVLCLFDNAYLVLMLSPVE